jgi:protein-tyrosine phosphatase
MTPATSICFVCLGNICRSPTAAAVMTHLVAGADLTDRIVIESAGTGGWHVGDGPDPRAAAEARRRGVPMKHAAQKFTARDFARFDVILAMDRENVSDLLAIAPDPADAGKVRLLRSYDPTAPPNAEVPDPYYGGPDGFADVFDMVERACGGLLAALHR